MGGIVMPNILVLDDEKEIADLIEVYLKNEGYSIYKFYHPQDILNFLQNISIDLAIIDIMMPEINGFELCQKIRKAGHSFPILMETAKITDTDKINGLSLGADDYITKPFNPLELVARVKAQLRRYLKYNDFSNTTNTYEVRGLSLNADTHQCFLYDKQIELTPLEFSILFYLVQKQGKVISSEELFEHVWEEKYLDCNNTVMVHIRRIREKLGESPRNPKFIKTVWGVGYKIEKG